MTALGICIPCGLPLAPDGSRTCGCRASLFADVMTVAAMRARRHRRDRPDGLDVRLSRDRIAARA